MICEALVCNIHWADENGGVAEGHNAYPASGCKHRTCERYADGYSKMHFGYIMPALREMTDKVNRLEMENELLRAAVEKDKEKA